MPDISLFYQDFQDFTTTDSEGVSIRGIRCGSGPPLLLLHGFPQTNIIWHRVVPQLISHYTLIIPNNRGRGSSSRPSSPDPNNHSLYAKSTMAKDFINLMDKSGYGGSTKFSICGHDRGARIAHKLCIDFPDRVDKCMLLDICPTNAMYTAPAQQIALSYWHWFFFAQRFPFPEEAVTANPALWAEKCLLDLAGDQKSFFGDAAYQVYAQQFSDRETVHSICEDQRAASREDIEEQKADEEAGRKIKCPVRVLWGKEGVVEKYFDAKKEWAKVTEDGLVDEKSCALPSGHFIPEEVPEELVRHIKDFFR
ncbi:MAG: hypothetical protein Q9222_003405 [Ikaeria aurantiellina]